ncbi:hypothetical protein [Thiothrix nivea]|uniref:hypothetical protein n=1 Tax=Thiothrix nivea TaxID=1031 RepID=UPI0012B6A18F|nr:hypothetical protein [Thiothrix nivea]
MISILGVSALCVMTAVNADEAGIGVGTATVLQLQLDGQDNIQDSMIGHLDSALEDTVILVGEASVVQVQTGGRNNVQTSCIGTHSADC